MKFTVIGDKAHLINESRMTELVKSPITGLLMPTITIKADKGEFKSCSCTVNLRDYTHPNSAIYDGRCVSN